MHGVAFRKANGEIQRIQSNNVLRYRGYLQLYWFGANRKKCVLRREQFVWRLIDGKAEYVHYRIFDEPDSTDLPPVDGVRNGKCEYGFLPNTSCVGLISSVKRSRCRFAIRKTASIRGF